jgi:hypothetical protein
MTMDDLVFKLANFGTSTSQFRDGLKIASYFLFIADYMSTRFAQVISPEALRSPEAIIGALVGYYVRLELSLSRKSVS